MAVRRAQEGAGKLFPEAPGRLPPSKVTPLPTDSSFTSGLTSFLSEMTLFCLSRLFFENFAQLVEKVGCRPPAGTGLRRWRRAGLHGAQPPRTAPTAAGRARHSGNMLLTAAGKARAASRARHGGSMAPAAAGTDRPAPPPAARRRSCVAVEKAREAAPGFPSGSGAVVVPHSRRCRTSVDPGRRGTHKVCGTREG